MPSLDLRARASLTQRLKRFQLDLHTRGSFVPRHLRKFLPEPEPEPEPGPEQE